MSDHEPTLYDFEISVCVECLHSKGSECHSDEAGLPVWERNREWTDWDASRTSLRHVVAVRKAQEDCRHCACYMHAECCYCDGGQLHRRPVSNYHDQESGRGDVHGPDGWWGGS